MTETTKKQLTDLSDEHLMQRVQAGKLNYMELLFNRYQKRLYNYFLKCTLDADESADLAQITFIRVMKYRASYNPRRGFEVWLFQIARNLVKDHFRKLKVHRDQYDLVESLPEHAEDDEARQQLEREHLLNQAMAKLPPEKRELLVMAKFQGMKYEQIAEITETSVGNVKVQVHRAIAQLRDLYFDIEHKEQ